MKIIAVASLALLSSCLVAQTKKPAPAAPPVVSGPTLQQQVDTLKVENASLKDMLNHCTIANAEGTLDELGPQVKEKIAQRNLAISNLEAAHPGMKWDPDQHVLVPATPVAPTPTELPKNTGVRPSPTKETQPHRGPSNDSEIDKKSAVAPSTTPKP